MAEAGSTNGRDVASLVFLAVLVVGILSANVLLVLLALVLIVFFKPNPRESEKRAETL